MKGKSSASLCTDSVPICLTDTPVLPVASAYPMAISLRRRLLQPAFIVREALVRNPDGVGLPVPVAVESVHLVQKPRALHSPTRYSVSTRHPIAVSIERTPLNPKVALFSHIVQCACSQICYVTTHPSRTNTYYMKCAKKPTPLARRKKFLRTIPCILSPPTPILCSANNALSRHSTEVSQHRHRAAACSSLIFELRSPKIKVLKSNLIARRRSPAFTCSVVEYRIIRLGSHSVTDEAELREEHPPPVAPLRTNLLRTLSRANSLAREVVRGIP